LRLSGLVQSFAWMNFVAFVLLAAVSVRQWAMRRDRVAGWAALAFLSLGVVVFVGRIEPTDPHNAVEKVVQRVDVAILLLFPYLLFRFTTAFRPSSRRLYAFVSAMSALLVVWTFVLPFFPKTSEHWPAWFAAYIVAFLVHWTVLSVVSAARLWAAGRQQPSVARRRMRLLALAAAAITVALVVVVAARSNDSPTALVSQLLALVSALGFLLGLAPPAIVRQVWRRPEQERMQRAITDLIALATTQKEVAARVLEPAADIVGARAIAIRNADGDIVGAHGLAGEDDEPVEVTVAGGSLLVWTTPYAPYFGDEELALLRTLGALIGIALDRVRLFEQEHRARLELERANQVKANFVALAAHELRTPVTTIHGFVQTLHHLGDRLSADEQQELRLALEQQTARMASLVEQLLDLSRLDADAVEIAPRPLNVRESIDEVVQATAAEHARMVEVRVASDLEARIDPNVFERILSNLVTNALKYGDPPVIVRAEQTDRHLRVSVEDRGRGISPEFVPDLFERFTRSDHSREGNRGTGLGLAIARSYARAHSGDLLYEPAHPQGSRFELVLPAAAPALSSS
jgi:signal transduction histidine kinase